MKPEELRGVVPIDKPVGVSSHRVVSWARKHLDIRKVGHTGTLDPLASGLLILLIGREATVQQEKYLKLDKEYLCTIRLGVGTDTLDATGTIVGRDEWSKVSVVTQKQIEAVLDSFICTQNQRVPSYSAVKLGGKKLYDLARSGEIKFHQRPVREITITEMQLESFKLNKQAKTLEICIRVACSSGTYVRVVAEDIGKALGLHAVVTQLRRTKIGDFLIENVQLCPLIPKQFYLFENVPFL